MTNERDPDESGVGPDGTIPDSDQGIAAGYTDEPSTFEPEEDEASDADEPS